MVNIGKYTIHGDHGAYELVSTCGYLVIPDPHLHAMKGNLEGNIGEQPYLGDET